MGFFKLGSMTMGSLFKEPSTLRYPFETKEPPAGLKGRIVNDKERCILCGSCMRACTTGAIEVDRKGRTWSINPYRCVQCGYCITVCPTKCLSMDPHYSEAAREKKIRVVNVPEHPKPARAKADVAKGADAGAKAGGKAAAAKAGEKAVATKAGEGAEAKGAAGKDAAEN